MTRLALAIFLAAATKTWACNSTETCVWANASRTIKNKAVGILQQEGGSAEEFLHLNPQTPTDMLQLQALVQGALDAMGPEHEDSAMTFLKTVRAAMDVVKTQINAPGLKELGDPNMVSPALMRAVDQACATAPSLLAEQFVALDVHWESAHSVSRALPLTWDAVSVLP
eukprot:CAMPEP_0197648248 /NCGR_PEP_ID=MMETSP1338-20131121/27641_1 /TAXON_ID=43686 ORGANISM="Pelagodinium beii, Strain RCC1491" /NCGR_SAMPLE_ID=MMETSP1338 /ASSEMBLY_ACC=CAM_ASM_000754 /LENGTH=168 /DNA_ID=CAMNT_0043222213 /DNA_START=55 /DNA_END=562 /DNA_ORIENTATION=+